MNLTGPSKIWKILIQVTNLQNIFVSSTKIQTVFRTFFLRQISEQ